MKEVELKTNLHLFIDQIDNLDLLKEYYSEMKKIIHSKKSSIWNTLSEIQKREILLSYEESENDSNLIDNEIVFQKHLS